MIGKFIWLLAGLLPIALSGFQLLFTFLVGIVDDSTAEMLALLYLLIAIGGGLLAIIALIAYCVHVLQNHRLSGTSKLAWILVFICCGTFMMPAYWFTDIMHD